MIGTATEIMERCEQIEAQLRERFEAWANSHGWDTQIIPSMPFGARVYQHPVTGALWAAYRQGGMSLVDAMPLDIRDIVRRLGATCNAALKHIEGRAEMVGSRDPKLLAERLRAILAEAEKALREHLA